ncbi:RNA-directed DNA polymerase, eukaryota [Tanacetum coccineum]
MRGSVFISNFPDDCSSRDLWKVCSGYGTVIDVFIPNKRSKAGKRFAFVHFIKVLNFDRLIENLKTIWIGHFHLSANPARFERPKAPIPQKEMSAPSGIASGLKQPIAQHQGGPKGTNFAAILKPSLVLDDSCLVNMDLANCVMGEVLQFSSINNLQVLLFNEGFHNTRIVYLGGLWVMIELNSSKSKLKFIEHVGVASWFRSLCNAQSDFAAKERIYKLVVLEDGYEDLFARKRICIMTSHTENILESFKLIVKGKVFWARAKELFVWSPSFKEVPEQELCSDDESIKANEEANNLNLGDENDSEVVSDTYFGDNGEDQGVEHHHGEPSKVKEVSADPFNIYGLLDKRNNEARTTDSSTSIPYPPGFTPANDIPTCNQDSPDVASVRPTSKSARRNSSPCQSIGLSSRVMEDTVPADVYSSPVGSKPIHGSHKGGSLLEVLDGMIKVGQTMGFSMDGCLKDMEIIIGLGSKAKKEWIRELNYKHKVSFLTLQETKMENISAMEAKILWGNSSFDHVFSEALGNSGGILCLWDPLMFRKDQHIISDNFVVLYGTWVPNNTKLLIVSVYAPQSATDIRLLWSYITGLLSLWNGEVLVTGDFNEVCFEKERLCYVFNVHGANEFNSFISNAGLVEIQLEALCLDKNLSDHRPILLREMVTDYGATPFRLYHSWFSFHGFDDMVRTAWNSFVLEDSNGMVRFKKKLQMLKKEIRSWVAVHKRKQSGRLIDIQEKLSGIDHILDQGGVSDEILLSRMELTKQMQDIKSTAVRDQMQKAKIQWAVEGDENSKFFHGIVNRKRVHLSVKGVMVDGEWVDEPNRVKEEFRSHFANRFQDTGVSRCRLNFRFPSRLTADQISDLEKPVSSDEIRKAVWSCGENKSPGPDGFTFEFFRKYWDSIGPDMCVAVEWFFRHNSFAKGCNASFITLIPKSQDPKTVSDFRPISLIGSLYKVVTKILAIRLSSVISDLISDVQTAFLPNRQILDGPFIINELLSWCRHKKQQAMVFKVDFAKAYDSVRWDYLDDVLFSFGFGVKWRSWIKGSLISGMASVLVNGSPTSEFQFHCGLKQGDPLAPYLFILVMESLHLSVSRTVEAGIFTGIKIDSALSISHLFMRTMRYLLKINLLGVGVTDSLVNEATASIGCSVMKAPFKYLGVMVGGNMSKINAWDDMVGKIKSRLSKWKINTLSIGGRLTLLKAVLGLTPIYPMSLYKFPKTVLHEMESLRRNFFNGVQSVDRKISWVKWTKVLASKKYGGLGEVPFNELFPRLYALENNKECSVVVKMQGEIDSSFRRHVRGGVETQQLENIQDLVRSKVLSNVDDRWAWDLNGGGDFCVKDARDLVDEVLLPKENVATRWIKTIPIKVNVFAWKLHLDRLPTRSNLLKRGIQVQSSLCPICNVLQEDTSHLFFSCDVALAISRLICRWWNVSWSPVDSYSGWLEWFNSIRLGSKLKGILEGVFYVSWWCLWNFRNQLLFASKKPRKETLFDDVVSRSFIWSNSRCTEYVFHMHTPLWKISQVFDKRYADGEKDIFDMVDIKLFSVIDLDEGLYALACNEDVRCLTALVRRFKSIGIFIEHVLSYPRVPPQGVRATIEECEEYMGSHPSTSATKKNKSDELLCITFDVMELDREEGFSDVEGSNLDNFGLSHDESFGVDDLDLNINLNLDLNVPHHATHEEVLVSEVPNDHVVKGYVDQQTKHGIGEESVEQGTYDEDDVLMYEESKIVEPDVEVHLFDGIDSETVCEDEVGYHRRKKLRKLRRDMENMVLNDIVGMKYLFYWGKDLVCMNKAFRVKAKVKREVKGDHTLEYAMLRDYVVELQFTNLNTTVKIADERNNDSCSPTSVEPFGLDGAFMKGQFLGQVLAAVGLDSNNKIYPLTHALVEAEEFMVLVLTMLRW